MDSLKMRYRSVVLCLSVWFALAPPRALGQSAGAETYPDLPRASLWGWYTRLEELALDRAHAYGGLYYDRGLFRYRTPPMDDEYEIDILTYRFSTFDDYDFYRQAHAARLVVGSLTTLTFLSHAESLHHFSLRNRHRLHLRFSLRSDLRAEQLFLVGSYAYRLGQAHQVGLRQTVGAEKPDLDFGVFYQWSSEAGDYLRADVMLLDVLNNFIFATLGVDNAFADTIRTYSAKPLLLALRGGSAPHRTWRTELFAGVQLPSEAHFASQERLPVEPLFTMYERFDYQGGLLEYHPRALTVGLLATRRYSRFQRTAALANEGYDTYQQHVEARGYLAGQWRTLYGVVEIGRAWQTDEQHGTDFDAAFFEGVLMHREDSYMIHGGLHYVLGTTGLRIGTEYRWRSRDLPENYADYSSELGWDRLGKLNHRLTLTLTYRPTPLFTMSVGASLDLDDDRYTFPTSQRRYDGGFFRLSVGM